MHSSKNENNCPNVRNKCEKNLSAIFAVDFEMLLSEMCDLLKIFHLLIYVYIMYICIYK